MIKLFERVSISIIKSLVLAGIALLLMEALFAGQESLPLSHLTYDGIITHGPILGRLSHDGVGVWIRTSRPARFRVTCRIGQICVSSSPKGETRLENDNTGWVHITGLEPDTTYNYEVELDSGYWIQGGTFTTLPHENKVRNPHNPKGLFNFSFEFGCCNEQKRTETPGPLLPSYKTMYDQLKGKIHFQIMNGDWLYEEQRNFPVSGWQKINDVTTENVPKIVQVAPTIVGVWENCCMPRRSRH
jgi:alkaline phosphatase D